MSTDFRTDFKTAVKQEEWYLRRVYPTAKDIPSCTNHLDTYFACNSTLSFPPLFWIPTAFYL
jgi:hypothetical protein